MACICVVNSAPVFRNMADLRKLAKEAVARVHGVGVLVAFEVRSPLLRKPLAGEAERAIHLYIGRARVPAA